MYSDLPSLPVVKPHIAAPTIATWDHQGLELIPNQDTELSQKSKASYTSSDLVQNEKKQ